MVVIVTDSVEVLGVGEPRFDFKNTVIHKQCGAAAARMMS